jgi:hypothetical protein
MAISFSDLGGGATSSAGFSLLVGTSGETTYLFEDPQPAGAYSITSQLGDTSFDVYLVTADDLNAGYTSTTALEATAEFNRIVVYGATANDILNFDYKPSSAPGSSGDVADGAAPFLTSATPTTLASIDDSTVVTGGNFATDVGIVFTGQDSVNRPAKNIVRSSLTSLIVTRPDSFPVEQEPYTMTATNAGIPNPSTNVNKLIDGFDAGAGVVWVTSSPLPEYFLMQPYSTTLVATDADGAGVTFAVTAGTLPTGLSLDSTTGVVSGTVAVAESQTFTVTATDPGGNSASREFFLKDSTFDVQFLVIAGGGGGAVTNDCGGGGGAGGYRTSFGTSGANSSAESLIVAGPFSNYEVTVGAGGATNTNGANSVFGSVTSLGGGHGGGNFGQGATGGSAGGNGRNTGGVAVIAGTANQGTAGGPGNSGGAGGGGGAGVASTGLTGGNGLASTITGTSVIRAGGGGGGNGGDSRPAGGTGGGGLGGARSIGTGPSANGTPGAVNTGSGGGGAGDSLRPGAAGGSGIVVLRYPNTFTITIGAGLTGSTATVGADSVTTITAGTGNVSWAA